ncbi:hypothetical protein [Nostoc sp.]
MTQKIVERGLIDWIVIGMLVLVPASLAVFSFLQPKTETRRECYQRATKEIRARYQAVGKTTIDTSEEIEAIASEIKLKCPN